MRAHAACRVMLQTRSESDPLEKYEILNGESTVLSPVSCWQLLCVTSQPCSSLPGLANSMSTGNARKHNACFALNVLPVACNICGCPISPHICCMCQLT